MYYWLINYPNSRHIKTLILVVLIPLMYFTSLIELKLIYEVWPLSVNILAYFTLMILALFISIYLTYFASLVIEKIIVSPNESTVFDGV